MTDQPDELARYVELSMPAMVYLKSDPQTGEVKAITFMSPQDDESIRVWDAHGYGDEAEDRAVAWANENVWQPLMVLGDTPRPWAGDMYNRSTNRELADALDGLADGQDDAMGQMLAEAADRLRRIAQIEWEG